jgi:hypothetical protein
MTDQLSVTIPFASSQSRARWAIGLLIFGIFLDVFAIGSGTLEINLIARVVAGQDITDKPNF